MNRTALKGGDVRAHRSGVYGLGFVLVFAIGLVFVVSAAWAQQAPAPDLVVTQIWLSPESPQLNAIIDIQAIVKNVGQGIAEPSRVVLRINRTIEGSRLVQALAPNQEATVTFGWVSRKGKQVMRVEANAFRDIDEANVRNNSLERVVELTPDLIVAAVQFDPPHPRPNSQTRVTITVRNTGGRPSADRVALRFQDGRTVLRTLFIGALEAGESVEISTTWQPRLGEHVLRFEVDSFKIVSESEELNNTFMRVVNISTRSPTGADLTLRSLQMSPSHPQAGETVTLSAIVVNAGNGVASNFGVAFAVDGVGIGNVSSSRLVPGEERRISVTWVAVASERLVRVKADYQGIIVESNEEDNVLVGLFKIGESLNRCSQQILLELDEQSTQLMAGTLGMSESDVLSIFMPRIKVLMENDFAGINVRLTMQKPRSAHSRLRLVGESRQSILGLAPLDFDNRSKNDTGTVFIGSFVDLGRLSRTSLENIVQAVTNTASHEVGHFLGLIHDEDDVTAHFGSRNLMAPSNEAGTFFQDAFFTDENLEYLTDILPLECRS